MTQRGRRVQPAGEPAERGREAHADRDRIAVPHPEVLGPLDRMAEGVPVVEYLPLPRLAQVSGDDGRLHRDRPLDELALVRAAGLGGAGRVRLDQVQNTGSAMNPALITSASPLTYSGRGSEASTEVSASTPAGG